MQSRQCTHHADWEGLLQIWDSTLHLFSFISFLFCFPVQGPRDPIAARAVDSATSLTSEHLKMLNLSHDWLTSFLPHILTKVHRVGFGMLSWAEIEEIKETEPFLPKVRHVAHAHTPQHGALSCWPPRHAAGSRASICVLAPHPVYFCFLLFVLLAPCPQSRMYTAVPFLGKDVPSKASEFSRQ